MGSEIMYIVELEIYIYIRSIVNEVIRTISDRFFFYENIFLRKHNQANRKKQRQQFLAHKNFSEGKKHLWFDAFSTPKPFRKKKPA